MNEEENEKGQKIETLVNEYKKAATHSVNSSAGGDSSGVYFAILHSPSKYTYAKKIC